MELLTPLNLHSRACFGVGSDNDAAPYVFEVTHAPSNPAVLAASASDGCVKIYDRDSLQAVSVLRGHPQPITGIRFAHSQASVLWSCCQDGGVRTWDLRSGAVVGTFENKQRWSLTAFDVSVDDTLIVAGSELREKDCAVLCWDARQPRVIGCSLEAHSDDVTQVVFNKGHARRVATGSTDGLVNIFDLSFGNMADMNDNVENTHNTMSSVGRIGFFGPDMEYLFALTHTETLFLWHALAVEDSDAPEQLAHQANVREQAEAQGLPADYLIDCVYDSASARLFLFGGTHEGVLQMYHVNVNMVTPCMTLAGGHSQTVRSIDWDVEHATLFSGGEDSMLCLWSPTESAGKKEFAGRVRQVHRSARAHHSGAPY